MDSLTVKQAAEVLRLHPSSVYRLFRDAMEMRNCSLTGRKCLVLPIAAVDRWCDFQGKPFDVIGERINKMLWRAVGYKGSWEQF
ncbi:MAG TPA: hypothetical protein VKX39_14775 [Bryobacteraceae bacterium]|nr:hypothetical protein [Bryobacteraceae bacterium]